MRSSMCPHRKTGVSAGSARARAAVALIGVVSAAALWACSNSGKPLTDNNSSAPIGSGAATDCSTANTGCPCTQGAVVKCGHVVYKSQDYVSCSMGTRTCEISGTWSDCEGNQVVTLNNVRLLAQPAAVSAQNECDPALFEITSILGLDGGVDAAIATTDAGAIQLTGVPLMAGTCTGVVITPSTSNLQITQVGTPPTPNNVQLTASLVPAGCFKGIVVPVWTVDRPDVATMTSGGLLLLQFPLAGTIHVTSYIGALSATATINVTVNALDTTEVDASLAPTFAATCGATDAGGGG